MKVKGTLKKNYLKFFRAYARPQLKYIIALFTLSLIGLLYTLAMPLILGPSLIDQVIIGRRGGNLFTYSIILLLVLFIAANISLYYRTYLLGKLSAKVSNNIRVDVFSSLQYKTLKSIYEMKSGDILSRLLNDVGLYQRMFTVYVIQLFSSIIGIVFPLAIMLQLKWDLALICIGPTLLYFPLSSLFGKILKRREKLLLKNRGKITSLIKESLSVLFLTKIFGLERYQTDRLRTNLEEYYESSVNVSKGDALYLSISSAIIFIPTLLLLLFGVKMVFAGEVSVGIIVAFLTYVIRFYNPITTLANLWTRFKISEAAFDRINVILKLKEEKSAHSTFPIKGEIIDFEGVGFSYTSDRPVLEHFTVSFERGLSFLIGNNGTGKTTILKLITMLYKPTQGRIRIDGRNISQIKLGFLRKNISFLSQGIDLIDASIYENIRLGKLDAFKEEVISAAKMAGAHDFISRLPNGYNTQVGEEGLNLSGGERQKIALARAILKGSPIILLDEVTSAIDEKSRKSIYNTLRKLENEKLIISTTHDYSEVGEKDRIIDLNKLQCVS